MTWSPFFTEVTPGPTSTTMPAPSWPKITGNRPSGSAPERVNSSVWHTPEALISTSTSPAFGPARSTVTISSGLPAASASAARVFMRNPPFGRNDTPATAAGSHAGCATIFAHEWTSMDRIYQSRLDLGRAVFLHQAGRPGNVALCGRLLPAPARLGHSAAHCLEARRAALGWHAPGADLRFCGGGVRDPILRHLARRTVDQLLGD